MERQLPPGLYGYDDLRKGDWFRTGARTVTADMIDSFAELSGDHFEIHMDKSAASARGFRDRVAHGLLVLSVVDGLKNRADAKLKAIATLNWDWAFSRPVYAGDSIRATVRVDGMRLTSRGDRGILTLGFETENQDGETVQSGTNLLMVEL